MTWQDPRDKSWHVLEVSGDLPEEARAKQRVLGKLHPLVLGHLKEKGWHREGMSIGSNGFRDEFFAIDDDVWVFFRGGADIHGKCTVLKGEKTLHARHIPLETADEWVRQALEAVWDTPAGSLPSQEAATISSQAGNDGPAVHALPFSTLPFLPRQKLPFVTWNCASLSGSITMPFLLLFRLLGELYEFSRSMQTLYV